MELDYCLFNDWSCISSEEVEAKASALTDWLSQLVERCTVEKEIEERVYWWTELKN